MFLLVAFSIQISRALSCGQVIDFINRSFASLRTTNMLETTGLLLRKTNALRATGLVVMLKQTRFAIRISLTFLLGLFLFQFSYAEELNPEQKLSIESCEIAIVNQDIENRYKTIQKKLENDFTQGLPKKLKDEMIQVRSDIDQLTLQAFELEEGNTQELNLITQKTVTALEKMIQLLPQASSLAPKVRTQYIVPFTNMNSLKADHQDCMMKIAVEKAQEQVDTESTESSGNIYKKLTSELNQLNQNLYTLETTDVQKFIGLRAKLLMGLTEFNEHPEAASTLTQQIPQTLNLVQSEIERVLPGLELSKKYYSIAH